MNQFQFPTFKQMYPNLNRGWLKTARVYGRFQVSRLLMQPQIKLFEQYLNQNPIWIKIFQQNLYRVDALLTKYCDNRFSSTQRLEAIISHFNLAEKFLKIDRLQAVINKKTIVLAHLTDSLTLNFNINEIDPFEGFFSINIQDQHQNRLYDASFTFLSPNQLMIASIQGPKGEEAQALVRDLTKQLHGVRPMFLLVNAFKMICNEMNLVLLGIPHQHQAKYRWNDSKRLLFNYDEFWKENNGIKQNKYWLIACEIERKALEDIQSKKRSMYRKRYEMLDNLKASITHYFTAN